MADDERGGADGEFRGRLGMVLLDMGDRKCGAVELEGGHGGRRAAEEGVGEGF